MNSSGYISDSGGLGEHVKVWQQHFNNIEGVGRENHLNKCFLLKYNNKNVYIGLFVDFLSPEIINDLIESFNVETVSRRGV